MSPRVPSIGSTSSRQRQSASRVPRGSVRPLGGRPSATRHSGSSRAISVEPVDERCLAHAIDGVDRVALIVVRDAGERHRDAASRMRRAPTARMRSCSARIAGSSRRASAHVLTARAGSDVVDVARSSAALSSGDGVVEEVAAADLRAREILEQARASAAADGSRCGSESRDASSPSTGA